MAKWLHCYIALSSMPHALKKETQISKLYHIINIKKNAKNRRTNKDFPDR